VQLVTRGMDEREPAFSRGFPEFLQKIGVVREFGLIVRCLPPTKVLGLPSRPGPLADSEEMKRMSATVYRQYDQDSLDKQYDNARKIPADVTAGHRMIWAEESRRASETLCCSLDLADGVESARERMRRTNGVAPK
jgi:hypothetical protein